MSRRTQAALGGGALAALLHVWMLTAGTWAVFARQPGADYFDAQAEAWLDGHWWIPESVASIEGIVVDGRTQIYFGPFPALLRMPVALLGNGAGRWSVVSMLLATAVAAWAAVRLLRQAERRWPLPSARTSALAAGLTAFVVPAGTVLVFLASRPLVYHEAEAWGAASALLAFSYIAEAVDRPSRRTTVLAVAAATVCALSRVSVALGPVLALGAMALLRWRAAGRPTPALAAPILPVAAMSLVNVLRFGSLLSIPFEQQVQSAIDPSRTAFFAENGGFFNLRFLPTTLFHYLQPLGLRPSGWFPFVEFPPAGRVLAGAKFDLVDRTASVPATMPVLVVLAAVGTVAVARRGTSGLRVVALGAAAGIGPVLVFGYVAHRYLADFVPFLTVAGVFGLAAVLRAPRSRRRGVAIAALGVLALAGIWTNVGLGILQQRLWGLQVQQPTVHDFVATRIAVDERLGLASPVVHRVDSLPGEVGEGDFVVVGDCEALYLETGVEVGFLPMAHWRTVEVGGERILRRMVLAGEDVTAGGAVLALVEDADGVAQVRVERLDDQRVRLLWEGRPERIVGAPFLLGRQEQRVIDLIADPHVDQLVVRAGGHELLAGIYLGEGGTKAVTGRDAPAPPPTLCRRLLASVDEAGSVR